MYQLMRRSPTIAVYLNISNIALIILLAAFAALGIVALFNKKLRGKAYLSAFCFATLAAFALEITVFNAWHYLKYFAGPPTAITGQTDENTLLTTDGTQTEILSDGVCFKNLNRKVTSVFVNIEFNNIETATMTVKWTDEGTTQQYTKKLYKYLPHENYAPIQPCGKVSELSITFDGRSVTVEDCVINKPIPYDFSGLRLLAVSAIIFAIIALVNKTLRAKTARLLFDYKFDPKNIKQNIVYAGTVLLLIFYSWVCVFTSITNWHEDKTRYGQYNRYLVDALIEGRTYLDYGHPELLLNAERPYDVTWREANGYKETIDEEAFDWAWYKGKYYCYYGIVPAALLYAPYKMITGNYLPNHVGTFLFCAISVILLAMLWRYCVIKYMRDTLYALYLFSFLTLFFTSGICTLLRYATFYTIVQSAGFMFTVAGILLLLKSVDHEKINHLKLFFACLCFALVFGCRPGMGLASLLVPVVLWRHRTYKLIAFAMLPYVIVAVPLCLYNYARFGSIFEFGMSYELTGYDLIAFTRQNVLGKAFRTFVSSLMYLFCPLRFSLMFPFVELPQVDIKQITTGILWNWQGAIGIINFPIVFCLLYLFKNQDKPKTIYVLSASLIISFAIIVLNSVVQGCAPRFFSDIAVFIIFPSLFCAYYWYHDNENAKGEAVSGGGGGGGVISAAFVGTTVRLSAVYALIAVSIFAGLFLFVSTQTTYSNPTLYRYLETSLSFFK